ncbi:MAG: UbiA-like polyprenyltransferase [Eubacteriales bacterium]
MAELRNKIIKKIKYYAEAVMFSHTVFSLTFALLAMVVAANGLPNARTIFFILLALVSGRTGANAINRVIDRKYDKKNERTSDRHLPSGKVQPYELVLLTVACYAVFVFSAYMLNPLCFFLSPVAILLFTIYSYTKRFTFLCHLVLGFTCAGAPVGAWFAVTGEFSLIPFILACAVMLWIAGFDIIYGTQDIEFDRANNLFSIPQTFGLKWSLIIAKAFHFLMIIILAAFGYIVKMGWLYYVGLVAATGLLFLQHNIVNPKDKRLMKIASYNLNQIISIIICVCGIVDVWV